MLCGMRNGAAWNWRPWRNGRAAEAAARRSVLTRIGSPDNIEIPPCRGLVPGSGPRRLPRPPDPATACAGFGMTYRG